MTEKPILFSAPMVRAILDGKKTQTRRVVKHRHLTFIGGKGQENNPSAWGFGDERGCWHVLDQTAPPWFGDGVTNESYRLACPYGQPGDRLWVKETWHPSARMAAEVEVEYRADEAAQVVQWDGCGDIDAQIAKRAWRPSIFMPRWASRITLAVESVRVERLHDISEVDAALEGLYYDDRQDRRGWYASGDDARHNAPSYAFRSLWQSINGGESWEANPWVWVVTFRRVQP